MNIMSLNSNQHKPSFQATVFIPKKTEKVLRTELFDYYAHFQPEIRTRFFGVDQFGEETFNFEKILTGYTNAIAKATRGFKGSVELIMGKASKTNPVLIFKDINYCGQLNKGKVITMRPVDMLPDFLNKSNPFAGPVQETISKLSHTMAINGYPRNQFTLLLEQIEKSSV